MDANLTRRKGQRHKNARLENRNSVGGPRIGRRRGGPGRPFQPGTNAHAPADAPPGTIPEMFRRGPDHIPRGSMTLMYGVIMLDEREALYRRLVDVIRNGSDADVM